MSFWLFGAGRNGAPTIDSLLANPTSSPSTTLDALLLMPDLLSEIHAGTNQRLIDFLEREEVVLRLGGWVLWGLGGTQEEEMERGTTDDEGEDESVTVVKQRLGLGGVVRRRDMDEMGTLEGENPDETEQEKSWAGFPRLSTEILCSEPSLTNTLFNHELLSIAPASCATPSSFLIPFWTTLLESTELQLETRNVQVGYWARVNGTLLSGSKGPEVVALLLTIPQLLPRLLNLLPNCSPINDILLLLLRVSVPPSSLITSLIPQTLRMLEPTAPLGIQGHIAAEELLRGVIELCSAAPPMLIPQSGAGAAAVEVEWRENGLARQVAEASTVNTLVGWMLTGVSDAIEPTLEGETPRVHHVELPDTPTNLAELKTSSLIQSISILVDLIRKNNSDFVEQQMLTWARRREAEESVRELMEVDGDDSMDGRDKGGEADMGPSLVDLGALLTIVAERLGGFQKLVRNPRSFNGPISTSIGSIQPLTLERFRICEFYAELLHCSNMSLLNREPSFSVLYDQNGYLARGWRAADDLAEALAAPPPEEEDDDARDHPSPIQSFKSTFIHSSPIDVPMTYSGLSTPSGAGSLDSESGILTRAEAKELRDLIASAEGGDEYQIEEDEDEGDDSFREVDMEMALALESINLEGRGGEEEGTIVVPHARETSFLSTTGDLPPGQLLKAKFMEHGVIGTILDLFFNFPWNNFLHNVVFDIIQQIFHGRIDRRLDRQLALSVFLQGRLIERILAGQAANDAAVALLPGARLGHMGHMSLVAEEIVKLFSHYPVEIHSVILPHIPQPAWDNYVSTTLRETRERDLSPLGGAISIAPHDTSSTASGLSDEDDEFPINAARVIRGLEAAGGGAATDEGAFGGHVKASAAGVESGETGNGDRFSRYLANAISNDQTDKFGSSDEDDSEDDAGWLGGSNFDHPGDGDFVLSESIGPKKFGLDEDRFEQSGRQVFRSESPESDDDADWGPLQADPRDGDDFRPTVASSAAVGFESSFSDDLFSSFTPQPSTSALGDADDDFGDFKTGDDGPSNPWGVPPTSANEWGDGSPSITLPSLPLSPSPGFGVRPAFTSTISQDGSSLFGSLSSPFDDPVEEHEGPSGSYSVEADKATTFGEPLGPGMHEGARLNGGFVEAQVDGKVVRVPADDIVLAHRRTSSSETERPILSWAQFGDKYD